MIKWLKIALLNWVMRDLWKAATDESYLKVVGDTITITKDQDAKGGRPLSREEIREYISEAKAIPKLPLFLAINGSMRNIAKNMIFVKSKSIDDIIAGKMILWSLDVMEQKYQTIADIKLVEKKKA